MRKMKVYKVSFAERRYDQHCVYGRVWTTHLVTCSSKKRARELVKLAYVYQDIEKITVTLLGDA